jgi:hypothetical protein
MAREYASASVGALMETLRSWPSTMRRWVNSACALALAASTVSAQVIKDGGNGLQSARPAKQQNQAKSTSNKPSPKTNPVLWPPPNVDSAVPPVAPEVSCPLEDILAASQQRVQELVENLERFTATEVVNSVEIGKDGRPKRPLNYSFNYLAEVSQTHSGYLKVNESRKETGRINPTPIPIQTIGLAIGAVIFHPGNMSGFKMVCEGLGQWKGKLAWQLHFAQRPEKASQFQAIYVDRKWADVKLKGRAWIAADSFQIEHLDFDLLEVVSRIRLLTEHMGIDYRAVDFPKRNLHLWLPESVNFYIDIGGHRFLNRHQLTNYLLFAVETDQEIQLPQASN